ncbi:Mutator-like transposase [Hordeum vulgare]|nr:Mutator-like transposase [Hordeum vulgare]
MSASANSATSPLPFAPHVEVDAEPDEEVPRHDDEDEILFPELVDRVNQQAVEDEYAEDPSSRARFDDTDDEEREENIDSLVLQEYDGEDMPTIDWNTENPDLTPGTVFKSMVDCRNTVTTYCIVTENSYEIKSNPHRHTCPLGGGGGKDKSKLAKTRPYLAVDASALNGRWRGQLAAASEVDGHNWLFPVASGVLEVESEESWVWFLQQLHNIIVGASFREEEQWAAANAEEHAVVEENATSLEDNAAVEENAGSLENEASEVAIRQEEVILSIREKRPREEETLVEPSSDAEFETMAYEGFEAIREEEVILSEVPLKISEPTDDRQLVITCSIRQSSTKPPPPEVKVRSNKTKRSKAQNIPARETRSKTVNPSRNTRSKAKI